MKKSLLLILFLVRFLWAQPQSVPDGADSLRSVLIKTRPSDYEKLFASLPKKPVDKAIARGEGVLRLAESEDGNPLLVVYTYKYLGDTYATTAKKGEALAYLQKALTVAKENTLVYESGLINLRLGRFYLSEDFLTEASEQMFEAITVFQGLDDTLCLFKSYYTASLTNYRARQFGEAVRNAQKAIANFERLRVVTLGDSVEMMSACNTMGLAAFQLNDFDLSLGAFQKAEDLAKRMKNEFWIGLVNGNRSKIYRVEGFTQLAIQNLKKDFSISVRFKQWASAGSAATTLADIFMDQKNWREAKNYLDTGVLVLDKVKETRVKLKGAKILSRYYESTGDAAKALRVQKEVARLTDSLMAESEQFNLGRFRARYELEKKQGEISSLQHNNELQKKEIKSLSIIIWSAVIILSLVVLLIVIIVRDSQRLKAQYAVIDTQRLEIENKNEELELQGQKLQEQNQLISSNNVHLEEMVKQRTFELESVNTELDRFLYHASHDIRRPIATMLGLGQVFKLTGQEQWQSLFEKVSDTARSMDNMLFKLQMAYELNKPMEEKTFIDLHSIIDETAGLFDAEFQRRNMNYIHVKGQGVVFLSHIRLMQIILRNLIENAVYFKKPLEEDKPFVRISSSLREDKMICIEVEDNGIGIDPRYIERVFDLYFRGTQQSKGNGLGLYLAMKAVTMLKGEIKVESRLGEGSMFTVTFPFEK